MWVADVDNEPLYTDNPPTEAVSVNEEEAPVSPNFINVEDHEMANLEMEAVENEYRYILEALSPYVEPKEAVNRAFLSNPPPQALAGITNAVV